MELKEHSVLYKKKKDEWKSGNQLRISQCAYHVSSEIKCPVCNIKWFKVPLCLPTLNPTLNLTVSVKRKIKMHFLKHPCKLSLFIQVFELFY